MLRLRPVDKLCTVMRFPELALLRFGLELWDSSFCVHRSVFPCATRMAARRRSMALRKRRTSASDYTNRLLRSGRREHRGGHARASAGLRCPRACGALFVVTFRVRAVMRELAIDFAQELAVAVRIAQINESTHPHMVRHRTILLPLLIPLGMPSIHAQTKDLAPEAQLNALLDEDLDATFRRNPIQATVRGVPGYNHLLPDLSVATLEREHARERRALERLKALDAKALRGQDRISYELLLDKMELAVEAQQFTDADAMVLTTLGGLHNVLPRAAQVTPVRKPEDYRDYIKRIRAAPKVAEDT